MRTSRISKKYTHTPETFSPKWLRQWYFAQSRKTWTKLLISFWTWKQAFLKSCNFKLWSQAIRQNSRYRLNKVNILIVIMENKTTIMQKGHPKKDAVRNEWKHHNDKKWPKGDSLEIDFWMKKELKWLKKWIPKSFSLVSSTIKSKIHTHLITH